VDSGTEPEISEDDDPVDDGDSTDKPGGDSMARDQPARAGKSGAKWLSKDPVEAQRFSEAALFIVRRQGFGLRCLMDELNVSTSQAEDIAERLTRACIIGPNRGERCRREILVKTVDELRERFPQLVSGNGSDTSVCGDCPVVIVTSVQAVSPRLPSAQESAMQTTPAVTAGSSGTAWFGQKVKLLRQAADLIVTEQRFGVAWLARVLDTSERFVQQIAGRLEHAGVIGPNPGERLCRAILVQTLEDLRSRFPQLCSDDETITAETVGNGKSEGVDETQLGRQAARLIVVNQRCGKEWLASELGVDVEVATKILARLCAMKLIGSYEGRGRRLIAASSVAELRARFPTLVVDGEVTPVKQPPRDMPANVVKPVPSIKDKPSVAATMPTPTVPVAPNVLPPVTTVKSSLDRLAAVVGYVPPAKSAPVPVPVQAPPVCRTPLPPVKVFHGNFAPAVPEPSPAASVPSDVGHPPATSSAPKSRPEFSLASPEKVLAELEQTLVRARELLGDHGQIVEALEKAYRTIAELLQLCAHWAEIEKIARSVK